MKRKEKLINKYFKKSLSIKEKRELHFLLNPEELLDFQFQIDVQKVIRQIELERLYNLIQEIEQNIKEKPLGKIVPFYTLYPKVLNQKAS